MSVVYARPDYIETLATSTPIADHVAVDFELRGCPISKRQLLEVDLRLPRRAAARHAGAQRLRRMQAQGQCLRDGGARHAVPRPGDACRLRRALPVLRPRLLRLLRPEGDAEPRLAQRMAEARRARHGRRALRRIYRTFNADAPAFREESERHGDVGRSRSTIWPASRARAPSRSWCATAGCSSAELKHLRAAALLRGLPARPRLHRGAGHHRADLRHLPGRLPDERRARDGERARRHRRRAALRDLRRLLYCGEWIESHTLHVYMLHAPDFLGYDGAIDMARDHGDRVRRGLGLKKAGNEIVQLLGGREIHPINVRVGGFYRVPRRRELAPLVEELKRARDAALETVRWVAGLRLSRPRARLHLRRPAAPGRISLQRGPHRLQPRPRHRRRRLRRAFRGDPRRALHRAAVADGATARPISSDRSPATA